MTGPQRPRVCTPSLRSVPNREGAMARSIGHPGTVRFSMVGTGTTGGGAPVDLLRKRRRTFRLSAEIGKGCEVASNLRRACERDQARVGVAAFSGVWVYT